MTASLRASLQRLRAALKRHAGTTEEELGFPVNLVYAADLRAVLEAIEQFEKRQERYARSIQERALEITRTTKGSVFATASEIFDLAGELVGLPTGEN